MNAIVFAYHNIGIIGIKALIENMFDLPLVITHIDNPDENQWYDSVADYCHTVGITCKVVSDVNDQHLIREMQAIDPDLIFSFYCRTLLSDQILSIPKYAALNLHGALLPKYRGCAPVNWVLINGETETGVTLHHMVKQADAGDIVAQRKIPISGDDTARTLYKKMEATTKALLVSELPLIRKGEIARKPQDLAQGSYYGRRTPSDGEIDWSDTANSIYNLIRGITDPYPGAYTYLDGKPVTIWHAIAEDFPDDLEPGQIRLDDHAYVGTGQGRLILKEIEVRGHRYMGSEIETFFQEQSSSNDKFDTAPINLSV